MADRVFTLRVTTYASASAAEVAAAYTGAGVVARESTVLQFGSEAGRVLLDCAWPDVRDAIAAQMENDDRVIYTEKMTPGQEENAPGVRGAH